MAQGWALCVLAPAHSGPLAGVSGRGQLASERGVRGADIPGESPPRGLPADTIHEGPAGLPDALFQGEESGHGLSGERGPVALPRPPAWRWGLVRWPVGTGEGGDGQGQGLEGVGSVLLSPGPQPDCPFSSHFVNFTPSWLWAEMIFLLLGVMGASLGMF